MDPLMILALGGLAGELFGGVVSLFGENKQVSEEQRRIELQAQYSDQQARFIRDEGNYQAGRQIVAGSQQASAIRTQQAVSGFDPDSGTSALNQAHVMAVARLEAQQVANNAARQARGYENEAWTLRDQKKKLGEAQKRRNVGGALGLGSKLATGLFGLDQEFDIFGGGGLPQMSRGASQQPSTYTHPLREALSWLE